MSFGIISHARSIIEQISSNHFERKKCQLFGNFNDSRDEAKGSRSVGSSKKIVTYSSEIDLYSESEHDNTFSLFLISTL